MPYIPDTRQPIIKGRWCKEGEVIPNAYYEGLLDDRGIAVLKAYEYAVEDLVNCLDDLDLAMDIAGDQIFEEDSEENTTKCLNETITPEQRLVLSKPEVQEFIKFSILARMEMQRNDLAVALIEGSIQEEHEKKYKKFEEDYNNLSKEEFYNKYPITEDFISKYDY